MEHLGYDFGATRFIQDLVSTSMPGKQGAHSVGRCLLRSGKQNIAMEMERLNMYFVLKVRDFQASYFSLPEGRIRNLALSKLIEPAPEMYFNQ